MGAAAAKRTPSGIFARPESARADSGLALASGSAWCSARIDFTHGVDARRAARRTLPGRRAGGVGRAGGAVLAVRARDRVAGIRPARRRRRGRLPGGVRPRLGAAADASL